jgi:hypothetical protein
MAGAKKAAGVKRPSDEDVISWIADAGEDALRWGVDLPRRFIVGVWDGVGERLREAETRLRAIDPLVARVVAVEERLDSLEKPKKMTSRAASSRAKPSTARHARAGRALEPERAVHASDSRDDAPAAGEQGRARADGEGAPRRNNGGVQSPRTSDR